MNELLPLSLSQTTHRPLLLRRDTISHSSSGPISIQIGGQYKVQKMGHIVKSFRKKLGKLLVRTKSPSPCVSVARTESIAIIGQIDTYKVTFGTLPDDILLQLFDFCRVGHNPLGSPFHPILEWHRLVHVCQRWRQIMFSSPRRLDLYLLCTCGTPVRRDLGLWPGFPILVDYVNYPNYSCKILSPADEDNIIAALGHTDRVRCLKLPVTSLLLGKVAAVAQEPLPILTQLWLSSNDENMSALPGTFLGPSAPCLQEIHLEGIPFPTLPALLSSATDLVVLYLHRIPHSGYIPPEVMVASLAALASLSDLSLEFQSSTSRPNQGGRRRRAAPLTRVVLPALTSFEFRGASEYLEDLVAQIDAPRLASIRISYFNQLVFQVPQLFRFIGQTQVLELAHFKHAQVNFRGSHVYISLYSEQLESRRSHLALRISSQGLDWQVSQLTEVLSQSSAVLSDVGHLSIGAYDLQPSWQDDMDHSEWLELFRQFTAVETLRVSARLAAHVGNALKDVTIDIVPEILPALRLLCLEDEPLGRVEEFINTRQLSGLPVTIANAPEEFLSRRGSHLWR